MTQLTESWNERRCSETVTEEMLDHFGRDALIAEIRRQARAVEDSTSAVVQVKESRTRVEIELIKTQSADWDIMERQFAGIFGMAMRNLDEQTEDGT